MAARKQPGVAFVLAGGASLGAIQIGMLRALYERGIAPDVIVGTSAGALNGAFIASRPQTVGTADALGEIWRGLRRGQIFPANLLTGLLGFLGAREHLVPNSGLRRLISRHTERRELGDMPIPLHVVAVDVVSGEELRLSDGRVLDAVLASAAVPGVLPPVRRRDRTLMDGAWPRVVADRDDQHRELDRGPRVVAGRGRRRGVDEPLGLGAHEGRGGVLAARPAVHVGHDVDGRRRPAEPKAAGARCLHGDDQDRPQARHPIRAHARGDRRLRAALTSARGGRPGGSSTTRASATTPRSSASPRSPHSPEPAR